MYTKLRKLLPTLMVAGAMAVMVLLAGPGASGTAMALTTADCRGCHTPPPPATNATMHHDLGTARGYDCGYCHKTIPDGTGGFTILNVNECGSCHSMVDHAAAHNNAQTAPDCAQCHSLSVVDEHLSRTSTCATCHSSTKPEVQNTISIGMGPSGVPVNCNNCHINVNHVAQHDMVSTPADCSTCHNLGPVYEHTNRTSTCATCHNSTNPTVLQTITLGRSGTLVSCANCHGTVNHIQQHDKALANADCAQCHNLGVVNEHLSRTSTCATCHSSAVPAVQQAIAAGKAGTAVYCSNCHASVNHVAQHDMVVTPTDCAGCHGQGVVYEHTNRTSTCATCHNSTSQAVQATIAAGRAGTQVSCANCHGTVNHVAQHDKAQASAECAQCHTKSVLDEHLTRTSTCATCHSSSRVEVQDAITAGRAGTIVNCVTCHGQYNHPTAHTGKVNAPYADCNSCHITNLTELHAQRGFQCAACHASGNAAVTAAVQKGLGGQPVVCADCHNSIGNFGNHAVQHDMVVLNSSTGFIAKHEEGMVYCFACHSKAGYQQPINDGMAGIPQTCGSCHVNNSNKSPVANAGADVTTTVNQAVTLSGAGSSDPDGTIASYVWNFGDGTSASGVTATKTYAAAGTYTVTLTVTDNIGASASDTAVVTVQEQATTGSVFADQVQYMQKLYSVTSSDGSISDVTAKFRDSNLTDRYLLQNSSRSSYVIAMKLNRDALTATKVVLRVYVSSISSSRTLRIYPYKSDGTSVNTSYSASLSTSSTGWKDIDVTSIAHRMNGYGWMKFRVTPTSSSLYVAEGAFQIQ